ncbi:GTP-binding protein [uncultured Nevskia sp.]|uniref:CobW family GTP-binding protein n=1 Tax=uncultured Nevskia sp. TaxID=228950 RepID=UPI0025FE98FC|nr:GTP-binding protein [uncultured Nevskia sp.]
MSSSRTIPVTVLTGFLGSGKTTLINRILKEAHGRRFAVIENEYGEINVDADLLVKDGGETIVQLTNGCVCCTVRGDLADALNDLARQRDAGTIQFDHVLIEPTGLADPGPIVRTFMAETELLTKFHLDGVVSLFDAVNGQRNLLESVEAQAQLGYADRILVTKIDLLRERAGAQAVDVEAALLATISNANSVAAIDSIAVPDAPWGEVFDKLLEMRGYQSDRVVFTPQPVFRPMGSARHTPGVGSISFQAEQPLDGLKFKTALAAIDERYGESLWRIKGVLAIAGMRSRIVVQGVQGLIQATPSTIWRMFEPQRSRLVLIGRDLDRDWLLAQLGGCVVEPVATPMH